MTAILKGEKHSVQAAIWPEIHMCWALKLPLLFILPVRALTTFAECILSPLAPFTGKCRDRNRPKLGCPNLHMKKLRQGEVTFLGPCSFWQDWLILPFISGCNLWP